MDEPELKKTYIELGTHGLLDVEFSEQVRHIANCYGKKHQRAFEGVAIKIIYED